MRELHRAATVSTYICMHSTTAQYTVSAYLYIGMYLRVATVRIGRRLELQYVPVGDTVQVRTGTRTVLVQ